MLSVSKKHKSDKVTHHGYERFYDYFLEPFKLDKFNLFEIGIYKEGSLKLWKEYFSNANIYGMDINEYNKSDYGTIFKGDQNKKKDLNKIIENIKVAKIIIDDGSHKPEHQLLSFNHLFKNLLQDGGIYIIEDIETSYWKKSNLYGYDIDAGYNAQNNIVNIFKNIVDIVNREFLLDEHIEYIQKFNKIDCENLKYISFIMFGQNCIIIKKMSNEEYNRFGKRKYRFIKCVSIGYCKLW
jgi:hypothetical protein